MLRGKKILLGISGSIAAYKSPLLIRLLVQAGAEVQVIATQAALEFTTPTILTTFSGHPLITDFYKSRVGGEWVNHVKLGMWADLMLVAPASANTLSSIASGSANHILYTTYLSARCPVWFAPAMDLDMYEHEATLANMDALERRGHRILEAKSGSLASGLEGKGRMQEPEEIFQQVFDYFRQADTLNGKNVLITAGPTREPIDPVRFLGNRSSGRMGVELTKEALCRGADVTMVCGPLTVKIPEHPRLTVIHTETAAQMYAACLSLSDNYQLAIMSAAVADFRPHEISAEKIKKSGEAPIIKLLENEDILKSLGKIKRPDQVLIGFALETNKELANARIKLKHKNADAIILNSLRDAGAGFGTVTNKATMLFNSGDIIELPLMSKSNMSGLIFDALSERFYDCKK